MKLVRLDKKPKKIDRKTDTDQVKLSGSIKRPRTLKHSHRQTDRQADRQTDRQTDRQIDRQTGRQTDRQHMDRWKDIQKDE